MLVKIRRFADTKRGNPCPPHPQIRTMASSPPPIPFLKDLGFPQPVSTPGTRLARKLGTTRTLGGKSNWIVMIIVLVIFGVAFIMLAGIVFVIALVAIPVALCFTKPRRRIIGWFIGRRQPIDVEITKDPLLPAEMFEGAVFFKKPGTVEQLQVTLQCVEEAKYRRGTDTYTDRHTAFEQVIIEVQNPTGDQVRFAGQIPPDAMHSFAASNNTIEWRLKVRRTFPGENLDEASYLLDVYTAELEQALLQYRQKNPQIQPGGPR